MCSPLVRSKPSRGAASLSNRISLAALALALVACRRASVTKAEPVAAAAASQPTSAPVSSGPNLADFERIDGDYALATSDRCGRNAFIPFRKGDDRAFDTGDFIGRAKALFGEPGTDDGFTFVLRHRPTGIIIDLYSAGSGPSFGGGPVYKGPLPPADPKALFPSGLGSSPAIDAAGLAQMKALMAKPDADTMNQVALVECQHATPAGFYAVASELEALLDATPPADWEAVQDSTTAPTASACATASPSPPRSANASRSDHASPPC
jgi:hypothetical protein